FQEKLARVKEFLVGSGATGCEVLINWAMMGVGGGPRGKVFVTDMDTIATSNLNRYCLFRPWDVGKLKSSTAVAAMISMNPDMSGSATAFTESLSVDSESRFNDVFWGALTGVTTALDNVEARRYVDRRCVLFRKRLLESGMLGTKGSTQVVLPDLTEAYSSSQDPPETQFKLDHKVSHFLYLNEHTIDWALYLFDAYFRSSPENVNSFLNTSLANEAAFTVASLQSLPNPHMTPEETLDDLKSHLITQRPLGFCDCVTWARMQFEVHFCNRIRQTLSDFPKDASTSSGIQFWSGLKKVPNPIIFNSENRLRQLLHLDFIIAAAKLRAFNYNINVETDEVNYYKELVSSKNLVVPVFEPEVWREHEEVPENATEVLEHELAMFIKDLRAQTAQMSDKHLHPVHLEIDDSTNGHLDFITAASNLRATNFRIPIADRRRTKRIAGNLLPAIVTTTAVVAGLTCLELYKAVDGKQKSDDYKNGFLNLALPFVGFSALVAARTFKYNNSEFTLWDRIEFHQEPTLQELLDFFRKEHELEVTMISFG
ncbi:hypothetical protein HDU93_003851, partial [Gonapodya sp. JEL0774]